MSEELNVIFHACLHGRTDIVQKAIQSARGDPSNPPDNDSIAILVSTGRAEDGQTPLHVAAGHGHSDVIRALLSVGAFLDVRGTYGDALDMRPYDMSSTEAAKASFHIYLFEAIALSNVDMVRKLLKGGVPATVTDGSTKMDSALHWAATSNETEILGLLLMHGANVNYANRNGQTALHSACIASKSDIVYALLEAGADRMLCDNEGLIALHLLNFTNAKPDAEPVVIREMLENPPPVLKSNLVLGDGGGGSSSSSSSSKRDKTVSVDVPDSESFAELSVKTSSASYPNPQVGSSSSSSSSSGANRELATSMDSAAGAGGYDDRRDNASVMSGGGRSRLNSFDTRYGFDDEEDAGDGCVVVPMDPILVLWPPPQRMNRRNYYPFTLSNDAIITLSAPSAELQTVSFLIEALDQFQFKVEIAPPLVGSIIKMHIDENICTKRNSYELIVDPGQVQIIGADSLGMKYGAQAFVQLMQLHSDLTVLDSSGVAVMKLPSVHISDWPDTDCRAVSWSYRSIAVHKQEVLKDMVGLLSRTRLNAVLLVIDNAIDDNQMVDEDFNIVCGSTMSKWDSEGGGDDLRDGIAAASSVDDEDGSVVSFNNNSAGGRNSDPAIDAGIVDLNDECKRNHIRLVPSLTFTTLGERVPVRRLKRFDNSDMVVLTLDFEQQEVAQELISAMREKEAEILQQRTSSSSSEEEEDGGIGVATRVVTKTDVENAVKQRCVDIMSSVKAAGYTTVTLVCNEWIKRVVNPLEVIFRFGLSGVERSGGVMCPARHTCKQVLCAKEFIRNVQYTVAKSRDAGSSIVVFPALLDSDVMMPLLLTKYHSFIYSGFAWNGLSVLDMLGESPSSPDASVLREVSYLLIFQSMPDINLPEYKAVLGLFTGELFADASVQQHQQQGSEPISPAAAGNTAESRIVAKAELVLYALLRSRENVGNFHALEHMDAILCVKYYKRLLSQSGWRMGKSKGSLEMDEFFSLVSLMHGLAKAIVYSYAGKEKIMRSLNSEFSGAGKGSSGSGGSNNKGSSGSLSAYNTPGGTPVKAAGGGNDDTADNNNDGNNGGGGQYQSGVVTYSTLLSWVAPGTNSDTANLLLEALEHFSVLWQRRYQSVWFHEPGFYANLSRKKVVYVAADITSSSSSSSSSIVQPVIVPDPHMKHDGQEAMVSALKIRKNFYRREREGVPTTAIFNAGIMARLPSPRAVEQTFLRLFGGSGD
jgi:hypothetical protein